LLTMDGGAGSGLDWLADSAVAVPMTDSNIRWVWGCDQRIHVDIC